MTGSDPLARARAAWMRRDAPATLQAARVHCTAADGTTRARALVLCARALHQLGHPADALGLLRAAVTAAPRRSDTWLVIADVLAGAGNLTEARHALEQAAGLSPADAEPWERLAALHTTQDRPRAAARAWREARTRAPTRADLAHAEVEALRTARSFWAAHEAVMAALQRFPNHPTLSLSAADVLSDLRRHTECRALLDRLIAADPTLVGARMRRVDLDVRSRRYDTATADIRDILGREPGHGWARVQEARVSILNGRLTDAAEQLDAVLAMPLSPTNHGHALLLRAELRGKQGDVQAEWDDLVAGQASLARPALDQGNDGSAFMASVQERSRRLAPGSPLRAAAAHFPHAPPAGSALSGRPPVFMFGFPRSGTTLCERILGAHPHLTATDELNLLGAVQKSIIRDLGEPRTEDLTEHQVRHLRQVFEQRARMAGFDPSQTRLIDKNPLNFLFIDLVRRVFPDSPVLMILRDPRDCVWSAFRQAFEPNAALVLTRTLRSTAQLYRSVFDFWQSGRTLPGLHLTELHYEHLVLDFEAGARRLVQAAGEPWDDRVLAFHRTLGDAFVRTPSFDAVGRRVNRSRVARWRPHAARLAEVHDLLGPHVQALGVETVAPELVTPPTGTA